MSELTLGLACPYCQGRLQIAEGERIVICPFCDQRSYLKGRHGVTRYYVKRTIDHQEAHQSLSNFLIGPDRASGLKKKATIVEMFVVYIPFWVVWANLATWVFGKRKLGADKYHPLEVKNMYRMKWNEPARDVTEFGVNAVDTAYKLFYLFDDEMIYKDGMVFEPVGSVEDAFRKADQSFKRKTIGIAPIHQIGSVNIRYFKRRIGIVYMPIWVARYKYGERLYQVTIDGTSGEVLCGRFPGNPKNRAALLTAGMAIGTFLVVHSAPFLFPITQLSVFATLFFSFGLVMMRHGFNKFFHGEEIEKRTYHHPEAAVNEITQQEFQGSIYLRFDP